MQVLGVSGSLRQASINSAMLRAAARLAPSPMSLTVYAGLGALPVFNPDETDRPGEAVVNTSSRAQHADTALREVLSTMAARIVGPASVTLPLLGAHLVEDGMVASPTVSGAILSLLEALQTDCCLLADPPFSHSLTPTFP